MEKIAGDGRVLKRRRIREQLGHIFEYPLTLVVAAMGFGKTTAARDYLEDVEAPYVWLEADSDCTSSQMAWASLARQFEHYEPEVGSCLTTWGFPASVAQRDRIIDLLEEWAHWSPRVVVLDDYHFADYPDLNKLLEKLVRRNIPGLHVLVLSRVRPGLPVEELKVKGRCHQLKSSLFELSREEIGEYFRLFGQDLSEAEVSEVESVTEGWITAAYLVSQRYAETGRLETGIGLEELIETAIMERYTEEEKSLLMSVSILERFTLSEAQYVSGNPAAPVMVRKLSNDNSFIRFDDKLQTYTIHHVLIGFLYQRLETQADPEEVRGFYKRAGLWNLSRSLVLPGLKFLLKAAEYDLIMEELEKPGIIGALETAPQDAVELFDQVPLEAKYRHPIGYLTYVDFCLSRVDMQLGARLLSEIEEHYRQESVVPPVPERQISGEIALARMYLHFNDLRQMQACCRKAHELLGGSSRVANKYMIFHFGCPSTMFLYYREPGDMMPLVQFVEEVFHDFEELSGGCGRGFESLIRAECSLEKGMPDQAQMLAQIAIYQAETAEQVPIILCATFTLARAHASRGKFVQARDLLDELTVRLNDCRNPVFMNTLDLCYGYLQGIYGEAAGFAPWLKSGDMKREEMFYQGLAFNYLVHAKHVLLEKKYIKLEVLCQEMLSCFSIFSNVLGYIHAYILEAIARFHLYGLEYAAKSLKQALALGRPDEVLLPFAEYGEHIQDIIAACTARGEKDVYVDRVSAEVSKYRSRLDPAGNNRGQPLRLTEREKEILALLLEGFHNKEIAAKLYLAEITVKKTVTSIYRKLGVTSRAAAVRVSLELGLP